MAPLDVDSLCVQDYNGDHYHHAHCRGWGNHWLPSFSMFSVRSLSLSPALSECHGHGRSWQDREEPQSANDSNITGRGVKPLDRPHRFVVRFSAEILTFLTFKAYDVHGFHRFSPYFTIFCSPKKHIWLGVVRMASMAQRKRRTDWFFAVAV